MRGNPIPTIRHGWIFFSFQLSKTQKYRMSVCIYPQHLNAKSWCNQRSDISSLYYSLKTRFSCLRYNNNPRWGFCYMTSYNRLLNNPERKRKKKLTAIETREKDTWDRKNCALTPCYTFSPWRVPQGKIQGRHHHPPAKEKHFSFDISQQRRDAKVQFN
jgi:hypothetical protein